MSIDFLFDDFDRLIQSPESVHRMRRFILDLAVRGKLAPQDPNDEPASELLKRITAEKARLVKAGKIKKNKARPVQMASEPFKVPAAWEWAAIGDVFLYDAGTKRQPTVLDQKQWLLELEDIQKDTGRLLVRTRVCERESRSTKSEFHVGDILYGKLRPYLNKVLVADKPGYSTTEIVALRPHLPLGSEYCALALRRPDFVDYVTRLGQGTKMPRLRTEDAVKSPFPLPPLAEQHRIVAKVDELMALCDQLEAARAEREATRDRLATASLTRLNKPDRDPATFQKHAAFALNNLAPLTTRPDQIKVLRQSILDLAVGGKLVPQDPNDEPASELLKRIVAENGVTFVRDQKRLFLSGIGNEDDVPYNIPAAWEWSSIGQLASNMRYGTSKKCDYRIKGTPVLRIPNVSRGEVDLTDLKFGALTEEERKAVLLRENDLLIVRSNGSLGIVGRAAVVPKAAEKMSFAGYLVRVRFSQYNIQARYVWLFMNSRHARDLIEKPIRSTVGLKNVNSTELSAITVPLPPLAEQRRIVAKVNELMALCDRLEASLSMSDDILGRLIDALLHEALEPLKNGEAAA